MSASVALVLVSHDGARWLPTVIEGIKTQTTPVTRVVAIDTGSKDESPALLETAFRAEDPSHVATVMRLAGSTTFPVAIRTAMDVLRDDAEPAEWVWILHDDSTPHAHALSALLAAAAEHPDADVLGPKLREWPSLRRLLEIGVTISGTGRRETGLERGEYDQGQHDELRTVLAVNTAGMLVRRSLLAKLGGFDPQLPIFGNDIDFGWRAATAGHRSVVVPDAIVFHAEAAHRGLRRTPLTGRHTHYQERRAALYTLLTNSRARALWLQLPRLALGTLLRMLGFLAVREVGGALDELAALISVFSRPRELLAARRERHGRQVVAAHEIRDLLAPWWLPYRHGLDFVSDVGSALTQTASDLAERRRIAAAEADPESFAGRRQEAIEASQEGEDDIPVENGLVVRFFTNPVAVLLGLALVLSIVGARAAFGSVSGGGLAPSPAGVGDWWSLLARSWHAIGQGTAVPPPPSLLPLALLGSVLAGSPALTVSVVLILAFPMALWGAWRLMRVVGRLISHRGAPRWLILWGATVYALVPAASGAWGDGRLGVVVADAALPWVVHAALGFAEPEPERRARAGWRVGLLLTLLTAFTPSAWLVALLLAVVVLVFGFAIVPAAMKDRTVWMPPAVAVATPVILLAVWWLPALLHGAGPGLLLDAGRLPSPGLGGVDLVVGRLPHLGAPWWLGLIPPVLALVALVPDRTRIPVLVCWIGIVTTLVVAVVLSFFSLHFAWGSAEPGLGFPLVLFQGACVLAAVLGGEGFLLTYGLGSGIRDWRRWTGAVLASAALVAPVGGLAWYVAGHDEALGNTRPSVVPSYMIEAASAHPDDGVLVVRGSVAGGLRYSVVRGQGDTLGVAEIRQVMPNDVALTALVRRFVSRPTSDVVDRLAASGVRYVVLPSPADHSVAAAIDASGSIGQASAARRATRAWELDPAPSAAGLAGQTSVLHLVLFIIELGGILVVAVLCVPALERRRR